MSEQEKSDYLYEKLLICIDEQNRIKAEMGKVLLMCRIGLKLKKLCLKNGLL